MKRRTLAEQLQMGGRVAAHPVAKEADGEGRGGGGDGVSLAQAEQSAAALSGDFAGAAGQEGQGRSDNINDAVGDGEGGQAVGVKARGAQEVGAGDERDDGRPMARAGGRAEGTSVEREL